MTAATSNDVVPVAIRNLVTYIGQNTTLNTLQLAYGPTRDVEREVIFIGDSIDEDVVEWATLGDGTSGVKLDFTSSFTVTIAVANPGCTAQEALERAYELRGALESIIRTNNKLGLATPLTARVLMGRMRHQFLETDEGVACLAGLVVRIQARL